MNTLTLEHLIKYRRFIAIFAILVSVFAWVTELTGLVYICPYCRVQRTVIGILGIMLLVFTKPNWLVKYFALFFGFLGAVVAAMQHFNGWKKISAGKFSFNENIFIDSFLLSGFALFIIIGLVCLILLNNVYNTLNNHK